MQINSMKYSGRLLVLIISFIHLAFADDPQRTTQSLILFQQGFKIEALNSSGFVSNTISNPFTISVTNPALMVDYEAISGGIAMEYRNRLDMQHDITINQNLAWIPQSFGIVKPFNDFRIGLGFSRPYTANIQLDEILITTNGNSDSLSTASFKPVFKTDIYSAGFLAATRLKNFPGSNRQLNAGFQANIDFFNYSGGIPRVTVTATEVAFHWKAGLIYDHNSRFRLGLTYEKGATFSGNYNYKDSFARLTTGNSSSVGFTQVQINNAFESTLPDKFNVGVLIKLFEKMWISGNAITVFWSQSSIGSGNTVGFSGNLIFPLSRKTTLSFGLYHPDPLSENYNLYQPPLYFSAGLKQSISNDFQFDIVIADSHSENEAFSEQTFIKMGILFQKNP